jgi:hypothetical protein
MAMHATALMAGLQRCRESESPEGERARASPRRDESACFATRHVVSVAIGSPVLLFGVMKGDALLEISTRMRLSGQEAVPDIEELDAVLLGLARRERHHPIVPLAVPRAA